MGLSHLDLLNPHRSVCKLRRITAVGCWCIFEECLWMKSNNTLLFLSWNIYKKGWLWSFNSEYVPKEFMLTPLLTCHWMLIYNQKGLVSASLAKFLDWLSAFVLRENKAAKKSVSFSCVCQMVPSLLQLVRRGWGHLDAVARSCEILQSPLPCEEDSAYDATERSICSGRHLPKSPPPPITAAPPQLPSLPLSRQPLRLSAKWAACQMEGGLTLPLTGGENTFTVPRRNERRNPPALLLHRQIYVTRVWLCTVFSKVHQVAR